MIRLLLAILLMFPTNAMAQNQPASWWLASGNNIHNKNTGNVGIGSINPQTNLDVASAIFIHPSSGLVATTTFLVSGTSWTVPAGVTQLTSVEVIGGGGGGGKYLNSGAWGAGGGGGAYSKIVNQSVTAGNSLGYAIGTAGSAGGNNADGLAGGDTYFCSDTSNCTGISDTHVIVGAKGGNGSNGTTGGVGGALASGVGTTKYSGGNGGNDTGVWAPAGGGGAAGPNGSGTGGNAGNNNGGPRGGTGGGGNGGGSNASNVSGNNGTAGGNNSVGAGGGTGGTVGTPNAGNGSAGGGGGGGYGDCASVHGNGGNGSNGTEWDSSHGSGGGAGSGGSACGGGQGTPGTAGLYGGGGAGAIDPSSATAGAQGLIVLQYLAPGSPPAYNAGTALDVQGITRTTAFRLTGNGAANGSVLSGDINGTGTWVTSPVASQWVGTSPISFNGNVGIGTSTALNQSLTVNGTTNSTNLVVTAATFNTSDPVDPAVPIQVSNGTSRRAYIDASGNIYSQGQLRGADLRVQGSNPDSLAFGASLTEGLRLDTDAGGNLIAKTNSIDRVWIMNGGNIGIGSSLPGQVLDVQGTVRILGGGALSIGSTSPGANLDVQGASSSAIFAGNVGIGTTFGNHAFSVMNGNVGIGTWNPTAIVEINGTAPILSLNDRGGNTGTILKVGNTSNSIQINANTAQVGNANNASLNLMANNTTFIKILAGGNVGIGSATPGQKLDVQGTVRGISGGTCTTLYQCNGGVDVGVIQTSACSLCPAGSCVAMNGCF